MPQYYLFIFLWLLLKKIQKAAFSSFAIVSDGTTHYPLSLWCNLYAKNYVPTKKLSQGSSNCCMGLWFLGGA